MLDPFVEHLERSQAGGDTRAFLTAVQEWLRDNLGSFDAADRKAYRLDELAELELCPLPTIYSDFNPMEALARLRDVPPSSINYIAMSIRDLFREGVTVFSTRECPQCDSLLRIMQEQGNPSHLGYECDVCIWAEDEDRSEWQAPGKLIPATTEALQRRGLLLRSV